jgi:hypothetical protein
MQIGLTAGYKEGSAPPNNICAGTVTLVSLPSGANG